MKVFSIFLAMILLSIDAFAFELTGKDKVTIDQYLANREKTLAVSEYKEGRSFLEGPITAKDANDLAILYTLEGFHKGNNYYFFLAVFKRTDVGLVLVDDAIVGGKGSRVLSFESIDKGVIKLESKFMWLGDATCCPTGEGAAYFKIDWKKRLKELNVAPKMP